MTATSHAPHELLITVTRDHVDRNGHVNNVTYVQWMQDAAVQHSRICGGTDLTDRVGATWVVRSHQVEYLAPAYEGDALRVLTWVADFRKVRSLRRYKFLRDSDQTVLARGETDWVFVDATTGKPRAIPPEIQAAFGVLSLG